MCSRPLTRVTANADGHQQEHSDQLHGGLPVMFKIKLENLRSPLSPWFLLLYQVWRWLLHTHVLICQGLGFRSRPLDSPLGRTAWRSCFLSKQIEGFFHFPSCSHEKQSPNLKHPQALSHHKLLHETRSGVGGGGKQKALSPLPGRTLKRSFCIRIKRIKALLLSSSVLLI